MSKKQWTANDMRDLSGKIIVVTGANSGIGYDASLEFARKGATVVLACRDMTKAHAAEEKIRKLIPGASVEVMALNLSSLASIRAFSNEFHKKFNKLDILCNNAGVMALPHRTTEDGFEMQFGTNHLGHFLLTGLLMDLLLKSEGARVVNVSSEAHHSGKIKWDDLDSKKKYGKWSAYGQSKLANLLFTLELQRRLQEKGAKMISVACHPGAAFTNLPLVGYEMSGSYIKLKLIKLFMSFITQSSSMGALPTLYAATATELKGGEYITPDGFLTFRGYPKVSQPARSALDPSAAKKLWEVSEGLTNFHYPI